MKDHAANAHSDFDLPNEAKMKFATRNQAFFVLFRISVSAVAQHFTQYLNIHFQHAEDLQKTKSINTQPKC